MENHQVISVPNHRRAPIDAVLAVREALLERLFQAVKGYIREQGRKGIPLRRTRRRGKEFSLVEDPCLEPAFDPPAQARKGRQFVQEILVVDAIEAVVDIGFEGIFWRVFDVQEDGGNRIMDGAAGPKPIGVGLKLSFPFGFQRRLDQCLTRSVAQGWDAELAGLLRTGFRDRNPAERSRLACKGAQSRGELQPFRRSQRGDPIDSSCAFAPVFLRDPSDRKVASRSGREQQALEFVDGSLVPALRGSVYALLEPEDNPLELLPGFGLPRLRMLNSIGHSDKAPTRSYPTPRPVPASAYLAAFPRALASRAILPPVSMRLTTYPLSR